MAVSKTVILPEQITKIELNNKRKNWLGDTITNNVIAFEMNNLKQSEKTMLTL